jgi:hypothetical protein
MGWLSALIERHNPRTNPYHFDFTSRMLRTVFLMLVLFLALFFALRSSPASAQATTLTPYYVDCDAVYSDNASGQGTLSKPWNTLALANQRDFEPGDALLLKRGSTCREGLDLGAEDRGSADASMTVADYGSGALPTLDPSRDAAIEAKNIQHVVIKNLYLTYQDFTPCTVKDDGTNQSCPTELKSVVHITAEGNNCYPYTEACTVRDITLQDLTVDGGFDPSSDCNLSTYPVKCTRGGANGIFISAGQDNADDHVYGHVDGVRIEGVESRRNHGAGILLSGTWDGPDLRPFDNVTVQSSESIDSELHHNGGDGVVGGMVEHGLVEGVNAHDNGLVRNARLGVWFWESSDVTMQYNESHNNFTPETGGNARDGGGFDCDLGVDGCTIQYNWSHDNEGEGYLLMQWPIGYGSSPGYSKDIFLHHSLSERDGQQLSGGIFIFGGPKNVQVHDNVVYAEIGPDFVTSVWAKSRTPQADIYNNRFYKRAGGRRTENVVLDKGTFTFHGNMWCRTEPGGFKAQVSGEAVNTFSGWQSKGYDKVGGTNPSSCESTPLWDTSDFTNLQPAVSGTTEERVKERLAQVGITTPWITTPWIATP